LLPSKNPGLFKFLLSFAVSDIVKDIMKAAFITLALAAALTVLSRSGPLLKGVGGAFKGVGSSVAGGFGSFFGGFGSFFKGMTLRIVDTLKPNKEGVPMSFSGTNDGWGVCTLRSKRKLGKTNFVHYEFDLPQSNQVLPLKLGQKCELCCLDNKGNVAKGDFYAYHPTVNAVLGRFSIVAPNKSSMENEYDVGPDAANLVSINQTDCLVLLLPLHACKS
jgi:hypothetical protein